tara:strand:- start:1309 stop:2166 length:858 start_codon:yes stop_codon:yes gene_type:complete
MSTQITTAFVNQFSQNIQLLSQQMGSLMRNTVRQETVNGEKAFFEQIGSAVAQKRASRHASTPIMDTPHARRMVTMSDYEYADLVDDQDKIRLLISPESTYGKAAAAAIGRAMDDEIIGALGGTAKTGVSGGTSTALPSSQKIAHGSAGLTIAKLISAKKIMDQNSVDPSIERYIVVSPEQIEDLLNTTSVTSADFNSVKALVNGTVDSFMGFKFITSNRLKDDGTSRLCYAYAREGVVMALGKDVTAKIDPRPDKSYSTQIYYCSTFGASRMQEEMVVELACNE